MVSASCVSPSLAAASDGGPAGSGEVIYDSLLPSSGGGQPVEVAPPASPPEGGLVGLAAVLVSYNSQHRLALESVVDALAKQGITAPGTWASSGTAMSSHSLLLMRFVAASMSRASGKL